MLLHSCSSCDVVKGFMVMSLCGRDEVKTILNHRTVVLSRVRELGSSYDILGDFYTFGKQSAYIVRSAFATCIAHTQSSPWSHQATSSSVASALLTARSRRWWLALSEADLLPCIGIIGKTAVVQ